MKNFVEIEVGKIFPHPNNPRKDLGDLTELSESIKENGIMQNLTVVKRDEESFTVIIGHRRLEASKLAGLLTVPCVISNMDEKKQLSTMLLENMQRSDLTVFEQAEGFQMMMDLGETAAGISKATGFSETTVRHRLKLLELDRDKLKETENRGATLSDYIELEKIKDIKRRNRVLADIGTSNFNYSLRNALEDEKWEEKKAEIIEQVSAFAEKTDNTSGMEYVAGYGRYNSSKVTIPKNYGSEQYFYKIDGSYIYVYRKKSEKEDEAVEQFKQEQAEKNRIREEKKAELVAAFNTARELRKNFVFKFSNTEKFKDEILNFVFKTLLHMSDVYEGVEPIYEHFKLDEEISAFAAADEIVGEKLIKPLNALLVSSYILIEDTDGEKDYYDYYGKYKANEGLDVIYEFLVSIGYEMSDTEIKLKDGTSELYIEE